MDVQVKYLSRKHYKGLPIKQQKNWFWYFKSSKLIWSWEFRLCGIILTIKESDSFVKLLKMAQERAVKRKEV